MMNPNPNPMNMAASDPSPNPIARAPIRPESNPNPKEIRSNSSSIGFGHTSSYYENIHAWQWNFANYVDCGSSIEFINITYENLEITEVQISLLDLSRETVQWSFSERELPSNYADFSCQCEKNREVSPTNAIGPLGRRLQWAPIRRRYAGNLRGLPGFPLLRFK